MKLKLTILFALCLSILNPLNGADFGAVWSSPTAATLNGIDITTSTEGGSSPGIAPYNLAGPDFTFAPLGETENCFEYTVNSNLTFTFSAPVTKLRLYLRYWRAGNYTLNYPFEVKSGSGFTQSGNEITVAESFASGIVEFTVPVSELSILSSDFGTSNYSWQLLQLGGGTSELPPVATMKVSAPRNIITNKKVVIIKGRASSSNALSHVEYKEPGSSYKKAKGTSNWTFRFRPKHRVSSLKVRAVDVSSEVSKPISIKVIAKRNTPLVKPLPKKGRTLVPR